MTYRLSRLSELIRIIQEAWEEDPAYRALFIATMQQVTAEKAGQAA